jgi:hypothetical protein
MSLPSGRNNVVVFCEPVDQPSIRYFNDPGDGKLNRFQVDECRKEMEPCTRLIKILRAVFIYHRQYLRKLAFNLPAIDRRKYFILRW